MEELLEQHEAIRQEIRKTMYELAQSRKQNDEEKIKECEAALLELKEKSRKCLMQIKLTEMVSEDNTVERGKTRW